MAGRKGRGCFEAGMTLFGACDVSVADSAMDVALDTAMNYLERTGQAEKFTEAQRRPPWR